MDIHKGNVERDDISPGNPTPSLASEMASRSTRIWQLSAGPSLRSYADLLLAYQVALIGPGDAGAWRPGRSDDEFDGSAVRLLANEAQVGDIVVLREGAAKIISIGLIAGEYLYLPQFDDVNGWDLQHGRRVRWSVHAPYTFNSPLFGSATPAFGAVTQPEMVDYVRRFMNSALHNWRTAALPPLPPEEPPVDVGRDGIPPALAELVGQALDLSSMQATPGYFGDPPAEHEMVTHFVIPLLRALGWPPERIALEWRRIDVAVFHRLPRIPENLAFVIEAKRPHRGVERHLQQALDYLDGLGAMCDVVVTDGLRYRLYAANQAYAPVAYANLERLKASQLTLFEQLRPGRSKR